MCFKRSVGVRTRIFLYFLLFTALLLVLLWLFQIVFLDDFYRMQKMDLLRSSSESIVRNIDNVNLQTLVDRIAEENNICVLVTDDEMHEIARAEAWNGCIIHHMNRMDLRRYARPLKADDGIIMKEFPLSGFRNRKYDEHTFQGRVPPSDPGDGMSMMTVQKTHSQKGHTVYIFLNTLITPVTSTVQTIKNELLAITGILVLLSFLLSIILSRRITRPIEEITANAAGLSRGEYQPVTKMGYREIEMLNRQLTQTAKDLHRVEEMQHELIANISHDLRTPLTLIEGYAEAMRDLPDENTPENMQVIIDETRRLTTLVNTVLELNSARRSADSIALSTFSLTQQIHGIITRYGKLTEQDGYHVLFDPSEDVQVTADEIKVQQVIYNLINNALTYTGQDKTVVIRQLMEGDSVRIEVADSGEGINPEDLPYIWDRYYRGSKPHKRAAVGSGLGLSIVKSILEGHGLRYGVRSASGCGTTFWFELQRNPEQSAQETV